jgi:hypothetical protein
MRNDRSLRTSMRRSVTLNPKPDEPEPNRGVASRFGEGH